MLTRVLALLLLPFALVMGAEKKSAAPAGGAVPTGSFAGTWRAEQGAQTGDLELTLRRDAGAGWSAEAAFSFEGVRIPSRMKSVRVEGGKVVLVFEWRIQDTDGQSTVTGTAKDGGLAGAYETKTADGTTRGTWTVKPQPAPEKKA